MRMIKQLQSDLIQTLILAREDDSSVKDKTAIWFSCSDDDLQRKFPGFSNYASTTYAVMEIIGAQSVLQLSTKYFIYARGNHS
ncbi:unnamed protein product [Schistosoma rodhaini]|nr:unnamed protein product [Schistosoma rodhaini]